MGRTWQLLAVVGSSRRGWLRRAQESRQPTRSRAVKASPWRPAGPRLQAAASKARPRRCRPRSTSSQPTNRTPAASPAPGLTMSAADFPSTVTRNSTRRPATALDVAALVLGLLLAIPIASVCVSIFAGTEPDLHPPRRNRTVRVRRKHARDRGARDHRRADHRRPGRVADVVLRISGPQRCSKRR